MPQSVAIAEIVKKGLALGAIFRSKSRMGMLGVDDQCGYWPAASVARFPRQIPR